MRRDRAPGSLAMMRDALVEARVSVGQSREARDLAAAQLAREQAELETVRRRGQLATQINDAETVAVATRFEQKHAERIAMLERKLAALETEVALGERELAEMTAQFKAMQGSAEVPPSPSAPAAQAGLDERDTEHNALRREAERNDREAHAAARLEELKRKLGL
jgi:hypothetical protein